MNASSARDEDEGTARAEAGEASNARERTRTNATGKAKERANARANAWESAEGDFEGVEGNGNEHERGGCSEDGDASVEDVGEKRRRLSERDEGMGEEEKANETGEEMREGERSNLTASDASGANDEPRKVAVDDMDSARASPVINEGEAEAKCVSTVAMVGPIAIAGWAEAQGQRSYMEDRFVALADYKPLDRCDGVRRSFFGVYDGHNGDWAAQYASESLHKYLKREVLTEDSAPDSPDMKRRYDESMISALKRMYLDCDDYILNTTASQSRRDGCTAVNVLQVGRALFVVHAGDSRAVIAYADGRARAMTEDHKPSSATERRRITAVGGKIEFCGCWRVVADHPIKPVRAALAVSRSLGDIDFKRPTDAGVTAEPDVRRFELDENVNFLILASDGLWDVIRDQEAGDIARKKLTELGVFQGGRCVLADEKRIEIACHAAAKELLDTSLTRGTSDNVTAIIAVYVH